MSTAAHRRRASALRAVRRRHDRASSGHAATFFTDGPRLQPAGRVARALADAFLTCSWERAALLDVGYTVLGTRPRWLGPIVTAVLRAYREAPVDRPRELAGFVAAVPGPTRVRSPGRYRLPPRVRVRWAAVRVRRAGPTRVVRLRWGAPEIGDLADLAGFLAVDGDHLDWYADRRGINRHASDERLRHYRYRWLLHRLIEAPKPRLRAIQRRILDELLNRVPVHDSVHGFVPGRSVHTFAALHCDADLVVRLDLAAFFTTVTAGRIYGVFRSIGYPEPVAHTLTALTTTRTPFAVIRQAPVPAADRGLGALLRASHLPQGAPSTATAGRYFVWFWVVCRVW